MKHLILFFVLVVTGCDLESRDTKRIEDVRLKNALKLLLVEARTEGVGDSADLNSVGAFVSALKSKNEFQLFSETDCSNVVFNPDLSLWKAVVWSNQMDASKIAIVVRRQVDDYAYITFDGRFEMTNQFREKW